MNEIVLRAPATIANFGPGFDIFALALKEPYDILKIKLNDSSAIKVKVTGLAEGIPTRAEENTAGLAAIHFLKKINSAKGVDIEIIKKMPSGAGLGTSAASAAACVYGLNRLLRANLAPNEIIDIASQGERVSGGAAHADNVAGCLLGGFVFVRSYNPLDVIKINVPDIPVVICVIKKSQTTSRGLIPGQINLPNVKEQMSLCASLIHAVLSRNLESIGRAINKDYLSEPVRSKFIPGYDEIKKKVLAAGAFGCNVSGGGSSIFALCEKRKVYEVAEVLSAFYEERGLRLEIIKTKASNKGLQEIHEL